MINYQPTPDIIDLFKRISSKSIKESFDAQLIYCDAIQPAFHIDVLKDKILVDEGLGIDIVTVIDCDKKWAHQCHFDVLLRCFNVLVLNAKHRIQNYPYYKDCMLIPYRECGPFRFGIEAHILVVE